VNNPGEKTSESFLLKQIRGSAFKHPGLPLELTICALLSIFLPASLVTPWGTAGSFVCLALSVIATIGIIRMRPTISSLYSALPILLILLIILSTIIAVMSGSFRIEYVRGTPYHLMAFITILTLVRLCRQLSIKVNKWMMFLIAISVLVSAIAIAEYIAKDYFEIDRIISNILGIELDDSLFRRDAESFRSFSTCGNPLFLGTFAAVMGVISFGFYLQSASFYLLLASLINMAGTFVSMSRSSWFAFAFGVIAVVIMRSSKRSLLSTQHYIQIGLCIILGIVLLMLPLMNYNQSLLSYLTGLIVERFADLPDSISYTHRLASPNMALTNMMDNPLSLIWGFGVGGENHYFIDVLGVFLMDIPSNDVMLIRTFDNTLVTVTYCFGFLGLFYFIWLIFSSFGSIRITRNNENLWHRGAILVLLIAILFYNALGAPLVNFLFALILGLAGPKRRLIT
jgi:hypothetical protein